MATRLHDSVAAAQMRAVEAGALPGHRDYVRFVVVSNIRSGSTMLTNLLDQHPNARTFFELFHIHPGPVPYHVTGYRRRSRDPEVMALRDQDPAAFLDRHVWGMMPRHLKAVGFKLLHTQARSVPTWWDEPEFADWWSHVDNDARHRWFGARSDLWATLAADRDIRIILLRRENLLEASVSALTAKASGHWGDGASGGYGQSGGTTVTMTTETLLRDFEAARRQHEESRAHFAAHPLLELSYEDLAGEPEHSAARLQDFLDLPKRPLVATTRKQATRPYADVVSNWDEVRTALAGTRWAPFLDRS